MAISTFWVAVLTAALGASIPVVVGYIITGIRKRLTRLDEKGQALSDLGNALAENIRYALAIPDEIRQQRTPANLLVTGEWAHATSRIATDSDHLTSDFRIFFEESRRLNEFLMHFEDLGRSFNLEKDLDKQRALRRMMQQKVDNIVAVCGNLVKNGRYLMDKIMEDPAWKRYRKKNPKPEIEVGNIQSRKGQVHEKKSGTSEER